MHYFGEMRYGKAGIGLAVGWTADTCGRSSTSSSTSTIRTEK